MKIAIVGAGKLGIMVTEALLTSGHSVTLIDQDEEILDKASAQMDIITITGNALQLSFLRLIHADQFDYLLAVCKEDEKNILIASFAKTLGCSKVIARVRSPEHMGQIGFLTDHMDIDYIINPDLVITTEIFKYLADKDSLNNGILSSGQASLLAFAAGKMPKLIGNNMEEIRKIMTDVVVIAIDRKGKIIIPHGSTILQENDVIYLVGNKEDVQELSDKVHDKVKHTNLQKVMIVGGGKTGLYLAERLSDFGTAVKLIEIDKDRCHYLAARLNNVMVLHGDATDMSLLEDENFDEMDAFVTATGFDEENLLLALMAKNHGIPDVIAKVSRESYTDIIEKMGIDMALNPLVISVNNIVRFIQGSKHVLTSTLIQGQGELMEVVVSSKMPITQEPICNLKLPDGVLIAAIHRGSESIIPTGNTVIRDGDRIMVFSLLTDAPEFEKFITVKERGLIARTLFAK